MDKIQKKHTLVGIMVLSIKSQQSTLHCKPDSFQVHSHVPSHEGALKGVQNSDPKFGRTNISTWGSIGENNLGDFCFFS